MMNTKYILTLALFFIFSVGSFAQEEPTPFSPILIQGNPNVGRVQAFAMSDVAIRSGITSWQQAGWTGRGVRVGVLDRGFGGIEHFEATFDTLTQIYIGDDRSDYDENPIIHGTQVLETIHAVAPDAELYVCDYNSLDSFALCIDWMIASQVNIINHSAGVPALPLDGSSQWALHVERAANQNILWVNAAGNFASGYYQDVLTDTNVDRLHEFRGNSGIVQALGVKTIGENTTGVAMLSWLDQDDRAANTIDIDLQILDAESGEPIAQSQQTQEGLLGDEALEYVIFDMSHDFAIQIIDANGDAAGVSFALFVEFADLPNGEIQRSIITPGDSTSALTVGALQGLSIAPYSSRGPLSTGSIKPDLVAPGEVRLSDGSLFVGTSAAAPVVAGAAALIWQLYPDFMARDVRAFILDATQEDSEIPDVNVVYGHGRLYLPLPNPTAEDVAGLATPAPTPATTIVCSTELPSQLHTNMFGFVNDDDGTSLRLRTLPTTDSEQIALLQPLQVFQVVGGPECADGYTWYEIDFGGDRTAWIAEGTVTNGNDDYFALPVFPSNQNVLSSCNNDFFFGEASGCPAGPMRTPSDTAYQYFEHGFMIWRSEPDEFFVFFNDGSLRYFHVTSVQEMPDNPYTAATPEGFSSPESGFGRIWGNNSDIRNALGWATASEDNYTMQYQNVIPYSSDDEQRILLYMSLPNGRIAALGLTSRGRFWRYV